ncbi:hypothetical protein BAE44_0008228, partial [Dichanthelium oligosanthes]
LRSLSASHWDEEQFIISLDHEHYTNHDDEYLNKPLPYFGLLATIFGNIVATGPYAKRSNEPLGTERDDNTVNNEAANEDTGTIGSGNRPVKRAKVVEDGVDCLVGAFERGTQTLATAIKEATMASNVLPDGLFESVDNLPGFELEHKSMYYAHLVANPDIARAFINLPFNYKLLWISNFFSEKC